jgi:DNA-binding Xre family transcriptional regulator
MISMKKYPFLHFYALGYIVISLKGYPKESKAMDPLSGRLRQIRKQAGLTQRQLEEQSGVPQNTISRIEIGTVQDVSAKTLANLARALKVSMDHLIGLDSEPEPQAKRKSSKTRPRTSAKAAKG